ncbi:ATP-binding protein [uncultured Phenylobacterium sp.]|uniref:sensor histidine kinase n=1 Tax=uncultured Phenylobacterium sp. TaxID=349273 RepID=UPI0025EA4661|nr:ATP-binding protein [uncultured Phenylobacterium sp.]
MAFDGCADPKVLPAQDAEARLAALHRQAGALVHDFNNLLTVILNANAALAEDLAQGDPGHDLIQVSQAAAEQGAVLVARLMDLSQGSDTAPMDCAEAVAATARRARLAAPRNVTVEVRLTDAPLLTVADAAGLESALLNLCVNASHAMPAGGTIMLAAQRWTLSAPESAQLAVPAGRYVVVSVADDGVGMPPEVLKQAMEPFFTTRRNRGGTGLGLASVRDFAQGCGGAFVLTSREGRGTTARLYLPAL